MLVFTAAALVCSQVLVGSCTLISSGTLFENEQACLREVNEVVGNLRNKPNVAYVQGYCIAIKPGIPT